MPLGPSQKSQVISRDLSMCYFDFVERSALLSLLHRLVEMTGEGEVGRDDQEGNLSG